MLVVTQFQTQVHFRFTNNPFSLENNPCFFGFTGSSRTTGVYIVTGTEFENLIFHSVSIKTLEMNQSTSTYIQFRLLFWIHFKHDE